MLFSEYVFSNILLNCLLVKVFGHMKKTIISDKIDWKC